MIKIEKDKPGRICEGIEIATKKKVWVMQSKFGEGKALYIFRDDDKKKDGKSQILQHVPAPNDNEAFDEGLKHMKAVAELICSGEIEDSAKARRAARDALDLGRRLHRLICQNLNVA